MTGYRVVNLNLLVEELGEEYSLRSRPLEKAVFTLKCDYRHITDTKISAGYSLL